MQQEAPINKILARLDDSIGSKAEQELNKWRHTSEQNEEFFKAFTFLWNDRQTGKSQFKPDTEQALSKVHQRLSRRRYIKQLVKIAAVFMALISISSVLWVLKPSSKTIRIIASQQQEVFLPDSTKVILAKGSQLTYSETFKSSKREVKLNGKAWFDVVHQPEQPFIVETDNAYTRVLGTKFTISSKENKATSVFLDEGKVAFKPKKWLAQNYVLEPGDMVQSNNGGYKKSKQSNLNASAWATHQLKFNSTPLADVIREIEAYYKVNIKLQTAPIGQLRFSGTIKEQEAYQALEIIALTLKLKINKNSNTFILSL